MCSPDGTDGTDSPRFTGATSREARATMVPYTIRCANCDASRLAFEKTEDIKPVREACPDCNATDYHVPARERRATVS